MEREAEIFAVGKWNGYIFTPEDLQQIAESFNKIGENLKVALKIGHTNEQTLASEQHALGWVDKVWVAGEKLMAHFADLPEVVYNAMEKKLYRNVSVELDLDVAYKGDNHPFVLTGVALLGADIPAVNTLADLNHYMSRSAAFSTGRRMVFSAIAGNTKGETTMELQKATEKIAELTTTVATFSTKNAEQAAEIVALTAKVAKFEKDAKDAADADAAKQITAKRTEVTELLEQGVKSGTITPAQRTQYAKLMRIDDDAALTALDIADVKALVGSDKAAFTKGEHTKQASGETTDADLPVDVRVANEINALLAKKEASSFFTAQSIVFARNPKLAREYADFNDKGDK